MESYLSFQLSIKNEMAFDFFGEGIAESPKVIFTNDEENFFQAKLSYLDPKSKGSIELGTAMSFIKFSGLPPLMQKKILENLKILGKNSVEYIEMKKIFRGIALAQNKIQPSLVNISANIRTKMPVFYDDDDDEQEEEKPQPKQPPKIQPKKQQQKFSPIKPEEQPRQNSENKYRNQKPPPPPQSSFKQEEKSQPDFTETLQYKKFEQTWNSVHTKGNYISGTQVKKQFGNSSNRKQLAKAWKICSQTEKGYLTKGQLFVFLFLIKDAKGNIPDTLNSKMKELIAKIDSLKVQKHEKVDNGTERTEKTERTDKSGRQFQISSSNMFENFDKSQNFQPNKERSHVLQKSQPFNQLQKSQNLQKMQKLQTQMSHFHEIHQKDFKIIERLSIRAEKEAKVTEQVLSRFDAIQKQTQNSRGMLEQVDTFLGRVQERNVLIRQKIDFLKENQDNLTDRLNQTCVKMRDLIVKQAQFIDELLGQMENEIQMDKERVTILENYTEGMNQQINMKISNHTKARQSKIKQSKVHIDQPSSSKETIEEKKQIRRVSSVEKIAQEQSPAVEVREEKKKEEEKPIRNEVSPPPRHKSPNVQEQPLQSPRNKSPHSAPQNTEQSQSPEDIQLAKRLHSKRVYTIQMINFITPISQQEYPIIVQRITSMTENQLDGLYAQLYKKYELKMQQQNKKAENEPQNNRPLTNDQFSSNNFPQVRQPQQQKQNEDFFA